MGDFTLLATEKVQRINDPDMYTLPRVKDAFCAGKDGLMKIIRGFALFLSLVLLLTAFAGCGNQGEVELTDPSTETTEQTEAAPDETQEEQIPEDTNVVVVSTPYGELRYQEQWVEFMKTKQEMEGDILYVTFAAEFNGLEYELFELVIGEDGEDPVTQITDAEGTKRNVNVNFTELVEYPELAEDEQNRLYAMQEDINFVVENIK